MTLGDMIYEYRTTHKISMDEFAARSGMSKGYVSMLEKNMNPATKRPITPSISIIQKAAKGMGTSFEAVFNQLNPDMEITLDDEPATPDYSNIKNIIPVPKVVKHIPLYDGIACGDPRYADSTPVDTIGIPDWINADFAIRCHGDSMVNARIHDGDIVYIRQQPDVDDGQIAAVLIDDDATLKRVYHKPYGVLLMPANDDYEPIVYTAEDCVNIKIMGRAVAVTFAVK